MKKFYKKGFTLAEVLITLAIIGVVAAITIPAVIQKSTNQKYTTALQKAYNTLKSVEQKAIADHGLISTWSLSGTDVTITTIFDTYFRPYLDILKDCGIGSTDKSCFYEGGVGIKRLNGTEVGTSWTLAQNDHYKVITSDGISYAFTPSRIWVSVTGSKGPNQLGRNMFRFLVTTSGIKPQGYDKSASDINTNCSPHAANTAGGDTNGYLCAAKVLSEGAMNY